MTSRRLIEMIANTGTYLDSPFHRYAEGKDLADLPLGSIADLDCVVARVLARHERAIDRLPLTEADVRGRAVLVHTGWDQHWGTERYFKEHPYLTGALAAWLVQAGAVLVGIDSLNIDGTDGHDRPEVFAHGETQVERAVTLSGVERGDALERLVVRAVK